MQNILSGTSKYRSLLMGIAILWIVFFHAPKLTNFPVFLQFPFQTFGDVGVDIFIFLSGFGIYYSLSKNFDLGKYFSKRIVRFLPAIPVFIFYFFIAKITSFHTIIGYLTLLNYWLDIRWFGYLSYAFLCYTIAPIFFCFIKDNLSDVKKQILFIIFLYILTIPFWGDGRIQGVSRIPVFLLGMYAGSYNMKGIQLNKKLFYASIILSLLCIFVFPYILYYIWNPAQYIRAVISFYIRGLFAPGFCFWICYLFNKLDGKILFKQIITCLEFIGKRSLEIFLVNSLVVTLYRTNFRFYENVLISIIGGMLYHFIYNSIKNLVLNNYKKDKIND